MATAKTTDAAADGVYEAPAFEEVDLENRTVKIALFNKTDAALASLREEYATPPAVTAENYDEVKEKTSRITKYRTNLEACRKTVKAPFLEAGKIIDAEAARIKDELVKLETPWVEAKRNYDKAEERKKQERIARLQEKVDQIEGYLVRAKGMSSADLSAIIEEVDAIDTANDFYDLTKEATEMRAKVLSSLSEMLTDQLQHEANEEARIKAEAEAAAARRDSDINDRINAIRQSPLDFMTSTPDQIDAEVTRLLDLDLTNGDFSPREADAAAAIEQAITQLGMLKAQAEKMAEMRAAAPVSEEDERKAAAEAAAAADRMTQAHEDEYHETQANPLADIPVKSGSQVKAEATVQTLAGDLCRYCRDKGLTPADAQELLALVERYTNLDAKAA